MSEEDVDRWRQGLKLFFILSVPDFHIVPLFPFIEYVYWVKYGEFKRKHLKKINPSYLRDSAYEVWP